MHRLVIAFALVVGSLTAAPALAAPSQQLGCAHEGCLPTSAQCPGAPPLTLGEHVGSAAACVAAGGTTAAYAGGNPAVLCGDIEAGGQVLLAGDANLCDSHDDDPLTSHVYLPAAVRTRGLPSLYLLSGSGSDWDEYQQNGFDPQGIANHDHVVVVTIGGQSSWYVDWADGSLDAEDQLIAVVRTVTSRYHLSRNRNQRAVMGLSMGGYGATLMGERHPNTFGDVVSLSGVNDIENPLVKATVLAEGYATAAHWSAPTALSRVWGDPTAGRWASENPARQVCGLKRSWIWVSSGNGAPDQDDPVDPSLATGAQVETIVRVANDDFTHALSAHGLAFTYRARTGIHAYRYWIDDAKVVLPTLMHRLTTAASSPQPRYTACG